MKRDIFFLWLEDNYEEKKEIFYFSSALSLVSTRPCCYIGKTSGRRITHIAYGGTMEIPKMGISSTRRWTWGGDLCLVQQERHKVSF